MRLPQRHEGAKTQRRQINVIAHCRAIFLPVVSLSFRVILGNDDALNVNERSRLVSAPASIVNSPSVDPLKIMIYRIADTFFNNSSPESMGWFYRKTPPRLARGFALHRFRRTVRWAAKHSPFYRAAFAERGIVAAKVRTPADLGDFFTTPEDLVHDPESFFMSAAEHRVRIIRHERQKQAGVLQHRRTGTGRPGVRQRVSADGHHQARSRRQRVRLQHLDPGARLSLRAHGRRKLLPGVREGRPGRGVPPDEAGKIHRRDGRADVAHPPDATGRAGRRRAPAVHDRRGRRNAGRRHPMDRQSVERLRGQNELRRRGDGVCHRVPAVRQPRRLPHRHRRLSARDHRARCRRIRRAGLHHAEPKNDAADPLPFTGRDAH